MKFGGVHMYVQMSMSQCASVGQHTYVFEDIFIERGT